MMRRTPLGYANEEREHLEKPLEAGVIEPSASEWAFPIERYRIEDIRKKQLNDEKTGQLIKWLESDQIPTQAELTFFQSRD